MIVRFFWDWPLDLWEWDKISHSCGCRTYFLGPLELQFRLKNCDAWPDEGRKEGLRDECDL